MRITKALFTTALLLGFASMAMAERGDRDGPGTRPTSRPAPPPPVAVTGNFTLKSCAMYIAPPTTAPTTAPATRPWHEPRPPMVFLKGTGTAVADLTSVSVTLDALTQDGGTATLVVTFDNPLARDTNFINRFTGTGKAVLTINTVDTSFDIVVIGDVVQGRMGKRLQGGFGTGPAGDSDKWSKPVVPAIFGEFSGGETPPPPTP